MVQWTAISAGNRTVPNADIALPTASHHPIVYHMEISNKIRKELASFNTPDVQINTHIWSSFAATSTLRLLPTTTTSENTPLPGMLIIRLQYTGSAMGRSPPYQLMHASSAPKPYTNATTVMFLAMTLLPARTINSPTMRVDLHISLTPNYCIYLILNTNSVSPGNYGPHPCSCSGC